MRVLLLTILAAVASYMMGIEPALFRDVGESREAPVEE